MSGAADREALAKRVVKTVGVLGRSLKDLEKDVRRLWSEFEKLKSGETIMGCRTKKEFCFKKLKRTPRAVRYMLEGGNIGRVDRVNAVQPAETREETVSPSTKADRPAETAPVAAQTVVKSEYEKGFDAGFAEAMHALAGLRFKADPSKCYQRHIRELYAEVHPREPIISLTGATVVAISYEEAATLIHKYEWLQTMGSDTIACYGLKLNNEMLGVACFGRGGSPEARSVIPGRENETICLNRGACVPWAPKNAGSFLIRHACKQAHADHGWSIFFAYSDSTAGEIGTVYQAVGWKYIGVPNGTGSHLDFTKDDKTISSYMFGRKYDAFFAKLGWDGVEGKYAFLRRTGWAEAESVPKKKWLWFEGRDKAKLHVECTHESLPYPKRPVITHAGDVPGAMLETQGAEALCVS